MNRKIITLFLLLICGLLVFSIYLKDAKKRVEREQLKEHPPVYLEPIILDIKAKPDEKKEENSNR